MPIAISRGKVLILLFFLFIILAASVPSVYFYDKYQKTLLLLKDPQSGTREEVKSLVAEVSRLMELPEDEIPTVATVSDKDRLKNQSFFQKAKNGDKVLIYQNAKKAILYDVGNNRILDVAPINIGTASAAVSGTISPTLKTALYNGTDTPGLTKTIEKILKEKVSHTEVVAKENAARDDYEKTVVIDLTGAASSSAQLIARAIGASVGSLPEGEAGPSSPAGGEAAILVIIGRDLVK